MRLWSFQSQIRVAEEPVRAPKLYSFDSAKSVDWFAGEGASCKYHWQRLAKE